jgi:hypothetical protein
MTEKQEKAFLIVSWCILSMMIILVTAAAVVLW